MYKATQLNQGSWRGGLFSHAAPQQSYQASLNQVNSGSLGAFQVRNPRATVKGRAPLRRSPRPMNRGTPNTYLPAFTPQQMRGLGYAYQDGTLGDDATTAATTVPGLTLPSNLTPATQADIATVQATQASSEKTLMLWCAGLTLVSAYLLVKH